MRIKYFTALVFALGVTLMSACDKKSEPQNQSTVSVFGVGTVMARPDMIQMSVSLSNVARTTRAAQEDVSRMTRRTLAILKDAEIEDKNITTASLTFRPEYEYTNRRVLVGQRAEQIINFSIDSIDGNSEKVSRIIDQLIQINGIQLNWMNFGVRNTDEYFVRSRELAFQKAVEKAEQYAELSNMKIGGVLSISEDGHRQILPMNNRFGNQMLSREASSADGYGSTVMPTGELEITTGIFAVFLLE